MISLLIATVLLLQADPAALIEQLKSDSPDVREQARAQLDAMGVNAKEPLTKALATATGDLASRIKGILDAMPRLQVVLRSTKSKHKVGEEVGLQIRIKNIWDEPVVVVGSLDGSSTGARYPKLTLELRDPEGHVIATPNISKCGNINAPRAKEFMELAPGKELDPYVRIDDYGYFANPLMLWKPTVKGKYTLTFTYDTSVGEFSEWTSGLNRLPPGDELMKLFNRVHHVKVNSKPLILTVED